MSSSRAKTMKVLAGAALAIGLIAGIVLFVVASTQPKRQIESMARAPVGCTTTLNVARAGTYYVWEESSTNVPVPPGGCEPSSSGGVFTIELTGAAVTNVQADPPDAPVYSIEGYSGIRAATQFEVTSASTVDILVSGPDTNVTAAIGRDPNSSAGSMRIGAIAAIVAGVVLALVFWLLGRNATPSAAGQAPSGYDPYGQGYQQQQAYHPHQQYPGQPQQPQYAGQPQQPQYPGQPQQPQQPQYPGQPQQPPQPQYPGQPQQPQHQPQAPQYPQQPQQPSAPQQPQYPPQQQPQQPPNYQQPPNQPGQSGWSQPPDRPNQ